MIESSAQSASAAMRSVAVIGGGATGLAAAYRLAKSGRHVRLFEAGPRLGGAVKTERAGGWLIEAGPNSFQENSREIVDLLRELGLEGDRVVSNAAAKKRFIVRAGKVQSVPGSLGAFLSTPLFSLRSKARLLGEIFKRSRRRTSDVSLSEMIGEHFGQEIVDYALNPFVSGVYAGDPRKLSARNAFPTVWEAEQRHGSIIRGMMAHRKTRRAAGQPRTQIISFREGLQTLVDALAAKLPGESVELNAKIEALVPGERWRVVWSRGGETHTEEFSKIVLALPAFALARLVIGALGERPLAALDAIEYPPVASLYLGFRRDQIAHPLDGFGALVPAVEKRSILGVLFSSSLFPQRAPEDHVALTVMIGGSGRPDLASKSIEEIEAAVMPDLNELLGVAGAPVFRRLNVWPRAIPQYQLGYEHFLEAMRVCEETHKGIHIAGHVRDGIALPACIESGLRIATKI